MGLFRTAMISLFRELCDNEADLETKQERSPMHSSEVVVQANLTVNGPRVTALPP
jgi:hypothetical protein